MRLCIWLSAILVGSGCNAALQLHKLTIDMAPGFLRPDGQGVSHNPHGIRARKMGDPPVFTATLRPLMRPTPI
ncbi:hypothetical protein BX661DRAFT_182572 [Kickxella alabastrina]|uniref:uncharacterized protein n=1 Tax=Kickxella alabastrina TaxID=61397 RepID=UPI00221F467A|nr:uncharacterized protein BX661DRAFT_182572 [Kickxella alabastrina]KAI7827835.1 hypothetical protein BX661DRAFT_182572 [Kickxella alabastrina]